MSILVNMTILVLQDAAAVSPSDPVFSSYFAQMLQECMASFTELLSSWGAILAAVWGYSLVDTVRLALRWEPGRETPERA